MQSNLLFAPTSLCVFFPSFPLLTLKSHEVAGLFGLPSDDAYAVLQTQNALNGHRRTERRCAVKFLTIPVAKSSYFDFL